MPYTRELLGFEFVQDWPVLCVILHTVPSRRSWKGTLHSVEVARVVLEDHVPTLRLRTELDPHPPVMAVQAVEKHTEKGLREHLEKQLVEHLGEQWQRPTWWQTTQEAPRFQDDPALWHKDLKQLEEQTKLAEAQERERFQQARAERLKQEHNRFTASGAQDIDGLLLQAQQHLQEGKQLTQPMVAALVAGLLEARREITQLKRKMEGHAG